MRATCERCGVTATVTPKGTNKFSITYPKMFASECPILAEKLHEKGKLTGGEMDCEHLSRAASMAFDRFWRRR